METTEVTPTETDPINPDQEDAAAALAAVTPALAALDPRDVLRVTVDVPRAARIALGAVAALGTLRPRIAAELPTIDLGKIDGIERYALAAWYAHGLSMPASSAENPVQPLLTEAIPLRENLVVGAEALAHRGYFPEDKLADIKAGKGFLDTANDLGALSGLYREHWDEVEGKTAVTREEIDRAAVLGTKLLRALGGDGQAASLAPTAERRARAYTLLVNAYEEARRAVGFLRYYEGDVDTLLPSLFSKPRPRKAAAKPAPATDTPPVVPPAVHA